MIPFEQSVKGSGWQGVDPQSFLFFEKPGYSMGILLEIIFFS
jgi:hypothetical protein